MQVGHEKTLRFQMTIGLKFRIYEVDGLYYLCSEIKGADQLRFIFTFANQTGFLITPLRDYPVSM